MSAEILKAVEMLLHAVGLPQSSEKKREKLAKVLLRIHMDIAELVELVERGRNILLILSKDGSPEGRSISITLLSQQRRVLQSLNDHLASETLAHVVDLHMPAFTKQLYVLLSEKGDRVWFTLDQLVSDGDAELSPAQWVSNLEDRMKDLDYPVRYNPHHGEVSRLDDIGGLGMTLSMPRHMRRRYEHEMEMRGPRPIETFVLATAQEIQNGHTVLDQLSVANAKLRQFLVEKFKLEDVL
jgi:hypothetical protein